MELIPNKGRKMYYASNIDARYGFPELSKIALEHGVEIDKGDIAVFDNPNKNRRKALVKTPKGIMLVHVKLTKKDDTYLPLSEKDGFFKKKKNILT